MIAYPCFYRWRNAQRLVRKSHATTIFLAAGDGDVLSTIREQKHLLHHRSHCRYRHRPQSTPRALAQGSALAGEFGEADAAVFEESEAPTLVLRDVRNAF